MEIKIYKNKKSKDYSGDDILKMQSYLLYNEPNYDELSKKDKERFDKIYKIVSEWNFDKWVKKLGGMYND